MAVVNTVEKWRRAVGQLQSDGHFGDVILQFDTGDNVLDCFVLDDDTLTDLTPDMPTLEAALDIANVNIATEQEETSFIDAMKPIIRAWHQGTQTTAQALASVNGVLNNHPAHKAAMNTRVWPMKRLVVNPLADVTLGNISGNANAEAAYLDAIFEYADRIKTWRELA